MKNQLIRIEGGAMELHVTWLISLYNSPFKMYRENIEGLELDNNDEDHDGDQYPHFSWSWW